MNREILLNEVATKQVFRGEVFWVSAFDPERCPKKENPSQMMVVVSNNLQNLNSNKVLMAPLNLLSSGLRYRSHAEAKTLKDCQKEGFKESFVKAERIQEVQKQRIGDYVGIMQDEDLDKLDKCIAWTFDLINLTEDNNKNPIMDMKSDDSEKLNELKLKLSKLSAENSKLKEELHTLNNQEPVENRADLEKTILVLRTERDVYKQNYEDCLKKLIRKTRTPKNSSVKESDYEESKA